VRSALWLSLTLALAACSSPGDESACGTRVRVERAGDAAAVLDVCAKLAVTEAERTEGLAKAPSLSESRGLLLVFPVEGEVCIQNGPVSFSIDEVFASDAGDVVAVERQVGAGDATARCHAGVRRVLEVNAGIADSVSVGDRLRLESE